MDAGMHNFYALRIGIMDAGKDSRKQRVYNDFKQQQAFL